MRWKFQGKHCSYDSSKESPQNFEIELSVKKKKKKKLNFNEIALGKW